LGHLAIELAPGPVARKARRIPTLRGDEQNIARAVAMKPSHGGEIAAQEFTLPLLKTFGQMLKGLACDFSGLLDVHLRSPVSGAS
jgi:hypothetical protein